MSKRKRADLEDDEHSTPEPLKNNTVDQRRLAQFRGTVEQGRKSLATALRLARGFERQKMGRRQKAASKEPQTLLRLREEVIILKELELEKVAGNHLVKSLAKAKRVRENPYFVTVYGTEVKFDGVGSVAEGNVLGRLFNSNPVKEAMWRFMKGVYDVLGIQQGGDEKTLGTSKETREVEEPDPMEITTDEEISDAEVDSSFEADSDSFAGFSDGEAINDEASDAEQAALRLLRQHPPSDSDSNDISVDDQSLSESESQNSSAMDTPPNPPPKPSTSKATQRPKPAPERVTSTAFLPSLNSGHGYYDPGPNSDSDSDNEDAAAAQPQQRKNRRGQRARQQIAEMKFGQNAKHLLGQQQRGKKDTGWDARKGAVGADRSGRGGGGRGGRGGGRGQQQQRGGFAGGQDGKEGGGARQPEKAKSRDDAGPIHPSWEAAKQRKMQAANSTATAFAGKKITFD